MVSLGAASRTRVLVSLGVGLFLATLAPVAPLAWAVLATLVGGASIIPRLLYPALRASTRSAARTEVYASVGLGVGLPAAFFGLLLAIGGGDTRSALAHALRPRRFDAFDTMGHAILAVAALLLLLTLLDAWVRTRRVSSSPARPSRLRAVAVGLALLCVAVFAARLVWLASVASVPTDLLIWSEAPFLVNILKLRTGAELYGPMTELSSYSYSPGVELLHYALLRPFGLELSLLAHRVLVVGCQILTTLLLALVIRRTLRARLGEVFGSLALPLLLAVFGCVVSSSFLAPHVHPDHALMLCFAVALSIVVREPESRLRLWATLALLPVLATVFKLTGAGIGLGLVLAYAWERRFRELGALGAGAVLSLLTIPLFDRTLGNFSAYAIGLQTSHALEWGRLAAISGTAAARLLLAALLALLVLRRYGSLKTLAACVRLLWVTLGFALVSLPAYAKHGGRENSLLPIAIGSSLIVVLALAELTLDRARDLAPAFASALLMVSLMASPPRAPLLGSARRDLLRIQDRAAGWVRSETAAGRKPLLLLGTVAWLAAGRRDVPRDQLTSASELFFGGRPELAAFRRRLFDGSYDGLFVASSALFSNPIFRSLRAPLEQSYEIVEPEGAGWPRSNAGYLIYARRK